MLAAQCLYCGEVTRREHVFGRVYCHPCCNRWAISDAFALYFQPEADLLSSPLYTPPEQFPAPTKWMRNWFSNMLPLDQPFVYQGLKFATVENFYQAMKIPREQIEKRSILASVDPHKTKKLIRNKEQFTWRTDWDEEMALAVMEFALNKKFAPGTSWHKKLMATGMRQIVEYNNWGDATWGIDVRTNRGRNLLGNLLIKIRDGVREL